MPGGIWTHTQSGHLTCGAYYATPLYEKSCFSFSSGQWKQSHTLDRKRFHHSSWLSKKGVMLLGGSIFTSKNTSELLTCYEDAQFKPHFNLKYDTE